MGLSLDDFLLKDTEHESQQKIKGFVADYQEVNDPHQVPKLSPKFFFQNKDLFISKHSRYAPYPEHSHQFLEINYVYKGSCIQHINGEVYQLKEGDILLMDVESRHSIEALGQKDLLINLLFQNKDISINWLKKLQGEQSLLYQFLLADSSSNFRRDHFLLISPSTNSPIHYLLKQLMTEYFLPNIFSEEILAHYLPIFFYELARCLNNTEQLQQLQLENTTYFKVLHIIDREYATIHLADLAKQLNFNKNYLSNLIKTESGQTFTQLVNQRKLMKAQILLRTTQLPIQEIAQSVGFSNKSYFYEKYKEVYGKPPRAERQRQ